MFALVLHLYALWLVKKFRATFSTNQMLKQTQSWPARTRFPALCISYMSSLRVLIGSLDCLCLLWLAGFMTLSLALRHSIQNGSPQFHNSQATVLSLFDFFKKRPEYKTQINEPFTKSLPRTERCPVRKQSVINWNLPSGSWIISKIDLSWNITKR